MNCATCKQCKKENTLKNNTLTATQNKQGLFHTYTCNICQSKTTLQITGPYGQPVINNNASYELSI